jgi:hypothetical protein
MNTPHRYIRRRPKPGRTTKLAVAGTLLGLVLVNSIVAALFHDRTYPGAQVGGKPAGNMAYGNISDKLGTYIPTAVTVTYKKRTLRMQVSNFGVAVDRPQIAKALNSSRAWPPAANLFIKQSAELPLKINDDSFNAGFAMVQKEYEVQPVAPTFVRDDYVFKIMPRVPGVLIDRDQFKRDLLDAVATGRNKVEVAILPNNLDQLKAADEQYQWQQLVAAQNTAVTYQDGAGVRRLTEREVNILFVPKGKTYELSDANIQARIAAVGKEMGITVTNMPQAVAATKDAVSTHQSLAFTLLTVTPAP